MRFSGKTDVTLWLGVVIALLVVFQQPIEYIFRLGRQIEERYGLAVVPGLVVLALVLAGHFAMVRLRVSTERKRRAETSRLVTMAHALTGATGMDHLRDLLRRHLSEVVRDDRVWAVMRVGAEWESLIGGPSNAPAQVSESANARATRLLELDPSDQDVATGNEIDGHLCFRLAVGDHGVGVLGAPMPSEDVNELRRLLAAVGSLLGITARNIQLLAEIEEHGVHDGLTGCFNRTHGMKVLDAELRRAKRARTDFSLVMLDLDHFKSVNDEHGHLAGDALLAAVGKKLNELFRNSDIKVRYGGEEFLVLLPDTHLDGTAHVAEIVRREMEIGSVAIMWKGREISRTASVGGAKARSGDLDAKGLIGRADAALYEAKNAGRNRVCIDGRAVVDPSDSEDTLGDEPAIAAVPIPDEQAPEKRRAVSA